MQQLGIEESLKIIQAFAQTANIAGKTFEDGKLGLDDLALIGSAAAAISELAAIDFGAAMKEAKDWSPDEMGVLVASLKEDLDIPQDQLESKVEGILGLAIEFYNIYCKAKTLLGS